MGIASRARTGRLEAFDVPSDQINEVEWLIDNADAYERLEQAIKSARHTISIAQLALDSDCSVRRDGDRAGTVLDSIVEAASQRNVSVQVLLNASLLLDTTKPLARFLRANGHASQIEIRGVSAFPQLLHAKVVIIDECDAFLLGSPLVNDYWDQPSHIPVDPCRAQRELSGRPIHDVSLRISGSAALDLQKIFSELWGGSAEKKSTIRKPIVKPQKIGRVQIIATLPKRFRPAQPDVTEILHTLVLEIRNAQKSIYIEHQYLSSRRIVAELKDALDRSRRLEVILVLNQNPDITAYQGWQNARLRESGLLGHPRVGVFALWSSAVNKAHRISVNQVFVHSKVVIIDDRTAVVGSANLDGVSLDSYGDDFTGRIARRVFRNVRNFELSAVIRDDDLQAGAGTVADLRARLWAEHLGLDSADQRSNGGSLDVWRKTAEFNVATLRGAVASPWESGPMKGHIFPYSTEVVPSRQLLDLGIATEKGGVELEFNPGWMEVRFSPNWIRNMFL